MNKAEIERLIDKYGRDIYSFCLYLTKSKQDADDLYQDSFLYVIEKKKTFEKESESKTYILSVAVRLWKDKKRKYAWRNRIIEEKYIPLQIVKDEQHSESEAENAVLNSEQNMMIQNLRRPWKKTIYGQIVWYSLLMDMIFLFWDWFPERTYRSI